MKNGHAYWVKPLKILAIALVALFFCLQSCQLTSNNSTVVQLEFTLPEDPLPNTSRLGLVMFPIDAATSTLGPGIVLHDNTPLQAGAKYVSLVELTSNLYYFQIIQSDAENALLYNESFPYEYNGQQLNILPKVKSQFHQISMVPGETYQPKYYYFPSGQTSLLTFSSDDPKTVSVSEKGELKALVNGTAQILVQANDNAILLDTITVVSGTGITDIPVTITSPQADTFVNVTPFTISYVIGGEPTQVVVDLVPGDNNLSIPLGNTNPQVTPALITLTFDQTPPLAPTVTVPGATANKRPVFSWQSSSPEDGAGLFRYRLDPNLPWVYTDTTAFQSKIDMADGGYTIQVQERDLAFNWSPEGAGTVIIDAAAPKTPVFSSSTTASPTNNNPPTWVWESGGGSGEFMYRLLPAEDWAEGRETFFTPSVALPEGPAVLQLLEKNLVGVWSDTISHTIVVDVTKPIITLKGKSLDSLTVGTAYREFGAVANEPGLTPEIKISGTVNSSVVGTYQITYQLADFAGNIANPVVRTVRVYRRR